MCVCIYILSCVCAYVCVSSYASWHECGNQGTSRKGQFSPTPQRSQGLSQFSPAPQRSQGLNSGSQAWQRPLPAQPSCHSPLPEFYLLYNLGFEPSHHLIKFFSVWEWLLFQVGLSYLALGQGNLLHLQPQNRLSELAPSYWWLAFRMEEKLLYFPTCISLLVFVCLLSNISVLILKWNPWFSSRCWIVSHVRVFRISCINSSVLSLKPLVYYLAPEFIQLLCRKVLSLPRMQHKQK